MRNMIITILLMMAFVSTNYGRSREEIRLVDLKVELHAPTNMVYVHESLPVLATFINNTDYPLTFWDGLGVKEQHQPGIMLGLEYNGTNLDRVARFGFYGEPGVIPPHSQTTFTVDPMRMLDIKEPGKYKLSVGHGNYTGLINEDGSETWLCEEAKPAFFEFTVKRPDSNYVARLRGLLHSKKKEDVDKALDVLADARMGIYYLFVDEVSEIAKDVEHPNSDKALTIFLNRKVGVFNQSKWSDKEISIRFKKAIHSPDDELRAAVARAINRWWTRRYYSARKFVNAELGEWFKRENYADCKAALLKHAPLENKLETLTELVKNPDNDIHVRFAAFLRMRRDGVPGYKKLAPLFFDCTEKHEIYGTPKAIGQYTRNCFLPHSTQQKQSSKKAQ